MTFGDGRTPREIWKISNRSSTDTTVHINISCTSVKYIILDSIITVVLTLKLIFLQNFRPHAGISVGAPRIDSLL